MISEKNRSGRCHSSIPAPKGKPKLAKVVERQTNLVGNKHYLDLASAFFALYSSPVSLSIPFGKRSLHAIARSPCRKLLQDGRRGRV